MTTCWRACFSSLMVIRYFLEDLVPVGVLVGAQRRAQRLRSTWISILRTRTDRECTYVQCWSASVTRK